MTTRVWRHLTTRRWKNHWTITFNAWPRLSNASAQVSHAWATPRLRSGQSRLSNASAQVSHAWATPRLRSVTLEQPRGSAQSWRSSSGFITFKHVCTCTCSCIRCFYFWIEKRIFSRYLHLRVCVMCSAVALMIDTFCRNSRSWVDVVLSPCKTMALCFAVSQSTRGGGFQRR